jgi:hypothetical protein
METAMLSRFAYAHRSRESGELKSIPLSFHPLSIFPVGKTRRTKCPHRANLMGPTVRVSYQPAARFSLIGSRNPAAVIYASLMSSATGRRPRGATLDDAYLPHPKCGKFEIHNITAAFHMKLRMAYGAAGHNPHLNLIAGLHRAERLG